MKDLISLILKPLEFFENLRKKEKGKNAFLFGLTVGVISQFIFFMLFIKIDNLDGSFLLLKTNSISSRLLILILFIYMPPLLTILFREFFGWTILKLLRVKEAKFKDIHNIICFSMVTNFWLLIPKLGFFLCCIHVFILCYYALKTYYGTSFWKITIFSFFMWMINIQPFTFGYNF